MSRQDDLFPLAFSGSKLDVEQHVYDFLVAHYPELDIRSELREMDAWLWKLNGAKKGRIRNYRRFVINWLNKSKRQWLRENRKTIETQKELRAGWNGEVVNR